MLKISKNIKKIALSLLVIGLAIGTQAFKSAEKQNLSNRFDKVYYHLGDSYVVAPSVPSGYTCQTDTQPCSIRFAAGNEPANDNPIPEGSLGGLTYTPEGGTGSYQEP